MIRLENYKFKLYANLFQRYFIFLMMMLLDMQSEMYASFSTIPHQDMHQNRLEIFHVAKQSILMDGQNTCTVNEQYQS